MKKILSLALFMALVLLPLTLSAPATACVGKTILIGSSGTVQQDLLAEIVSILISERTGTSVKVVRYQSAVEVHDALMKHDLDLALQYTGNSQVVILKEKPISDPNELFESVKSRYNEELNLVWLHPFGFEEPREVPVAIPAQAAPVIRKDTIVKFPALPRLLNKLGGAIDKETIHRLEVAAGDGNVNKVARGFLKANRLI